MEFLKEEMKTGVEVSVEHLALVHLSLASCYFAMELEGKALRELSHLIALPSQGDGLARLQKILPERVTKAKLAYFDNDTPEMKSRVKHLQFVQSQLKIWLSTILEERGRLAKMKRQAMELISGHEGLREKWKRLEVDSLKRAQRSEDELALQAFTVFTTKFKTKKLEDERKRLGGIKWVKIPAGSFMMGSNDGSSDEKPVHKVRLKSFFISKTEVTVGQYRVCVKVGKCSKAKTGSLCNWGKSNREDHPINCINWNQARTFAKWTGGDLCSESQWEYSARAGKNFKYAGSNDPNEVGWYYENSGYTFIDLINPLKQRMQTHPVGEKKKNAWGLYDMSGNVYEWTLDEYKESYSGAPANGLPVCSRPECRQKTSRRVIRGGSWNLIARPLRVAARSYGAPRGFSLGARLCRTFP